MLNLQGCVIPGPPHPANMTGWFAFPVEASGNDPKPDGHRSPEVDDRAAGLLESRLDGARILVVEDEAIVATDLEFALRDAGAYVLGPAATLSQAFEIAEAVQEIDAAILDVDLGGEDVFPLAGWLAERGIPFVFHTGVRRTDEMEEFLRNARVRLKPVDAETLLGDLADLMG